MHLPMAMRRSPQIFESATGLAVELEESMSGKLFFSLLTVLILGVAVVGQKMKPEDVIAKHLESIGTAEKRSAVTSMLVVGDVLVTFVTQKNQTAQGRLVVASSGEKIFLGMNLNAVDYPLEKFSFDGKDAKVAYVRTTERSTLGNFILSNKLLLEESLLGGTLSTSWALANLSPTKAKVSFGGQKKIDGQEVYMLSYSPKGGSDVDVDLYFDKATFRHVRSEYKRISSAGIGLRPEQSSGFIETRIKMTEDFGDYRDEGGLALPHSYKITYSISGQNGTSEVQWKFDLTQFAFNQKLDDKTFDIDAKQND
jgi:hypothetical protein